MAEISERATRALAWLALAGLAVLVAAVVYLHPALGSPSVGGPSHQEPVSRPATASLILLEASFLDADHGTAEFAPPNGVTTTDSLVTFVTVDGGRHWTRLSGPGSAFYEGPNRIVRQSLSSTRISEDGGRTWRTLRDPRFTRSPYDPPPRFLDSRNGWWLEESTYLWRTRDGGRTWTPLPDLSIAFGHRASSPEFANQTHGFITVAATALGGEWLVLTTDDGGESWHRVLSVNTPVPNTAALLLAVYRDGGRLTVALEGIEGLVTTPSGGISLPGPSAMIVSHAFTLESDDDGRTWGPMRAGPSVAGPGGSVLYAALPVMDGGRLLLLEGHRLWTSTDGGLSWVARVAVMPSGLYPTSPVHAVRGAMFVEAGPRLPPGEVVPGPPVPALLRSLDGGIHWEQVSLPRPSR